MAGEINRVPAGLLSILDMKARGQNPRTLASEVSGTLELLPLYMQQNRRVETATVTPAAVANHNILTVPQNEYWYVHGLSISSGTLGAGVMFKFAFGWRTVTSTGAVIILTIQDPVEFVAGEQIKMGLTGPWLIGPGVTVSIATTAYAVGGVATTCAVDFTPIPV